jgi:malate dehydrogenase (oxaloacetate-decarboxylating)
MLDFQIIQDPKTKTSYIQTSLSGKPLLTTPQLNKGSAFTTEERQIFGLKGKLPEHIETIEEQAQRGYLQFKSYETDLQKNVYLNHLHNTNQVLFYKLVETHESEMIPILYTPTVGTAVKKFSLEFQQARGLYITYEQRYEIEEMLDNRSNPDIDIIVASDGGGVLGIGDQGAGAMLIPVAKLMVYTICGGINPYNTLPIMLDVGTNNRKLLEDPFYLGWRHPRIEGEKYDEFIELFVSAVKKKFPHVFLHWEDFGRDTASKILHNYRKDICSFNDDIQGTGATALAALLAAVKSKGENIQDQRILMYGAGTAGMGITNQIFREIADDVNITVEQAREKFWLVDRPGLLLDNTETLTPDQKPYTRKVDEINSWKNKDTTDLANIIDNVKPTAIIGCSAQSAAFTEQAIKAMYQHNKRPIIFPLSNPTPKAEAMPQDLMNWTDGNALVATGSPFPDVSVNGKKRRIAQCNNALVFPGLGLGIIAAEAKEVTDNMIRAACMALNECAPIHNDPKKALLPRVEEARKSAHEIAIAVAHQARLDGVSSIKSVHEIEQRVNDKMWKPEYVPLRLK